MKTHTSVYWVPKAGNKASENQDAFSWPDTTEGYCDLSEQKFAVADGATEAIFSGPWAALLTGAWHEGSFDFGEEIDEALASLSARWKESVPSTALPWWAEEKIENGAFATLVGLTLSDPLNGTDIPDERCTWNLKAIGDSCMFIVRENRLVFAGPLTRSEEFSSSPYLIGSSQSFNTSLRDHLFERSGTLFSGDEVILATDAIASWFLSKIERGSDPLDLFGFMERMDSENAFAEFIESARATNEMRNDDVTLMLIHVR